MYDIKFEESGLLAEFFGFGKVQLESSTKYICEYLVSGRAHCTFSVYRSHIISFVYNYFAEGTR